MSGSGEIVLVTGGSGFIGQHIVQQLLRDQASLGIREIRTLDQQPFVNKIGMPETALLRTFVADICEAGELDDAFAGVGSVFHCAALVSLEYPPNYAALERANVDGTRKIVELCVKHNVQRLIYTSCASVCLVPFKGSTFTIVINQTESKAASPTFDAQKPMDFDRSFVVAGYSSTKLRAETIVLHANGVTLSNKNDYLSSVAIRPPLTYGEGDERFVPGAFAYLARHGNVYPRIAGAGGKQQLVYAGNVAWGHVCAYKTLKATPKAIAGLPVFVTDDTPINDVSRFLQKMALLGERPKVKLSLWYVPHFLFFLFAFLAELLVRLLYPLTNYKLPVSLRALASFTASVCLFNRLRSEIHMDYTPLVESDAALRRSAVWYARQHDDAAAAGKRDQHKRRS